MLSKNASFFLRSHKIAHRLLARALSNHTHTQVVRNVDNLIKPKYKEYSYAMSKTNNMHLLCDTVSDWFNSTISDRVWISYFFRFEIFRIFGFGFRIFQIQNPNTNPNIRKISNPKIPQSKLDPKTRFFLCTCSLLKKILKSSCPVWHDPMELNQGCFLLLFGVRKCKFLSTLGTRCSKKRMHFWSTNLIFLQFSYIQKAAALN